MKAIKRVVSTLLALVMVLAMTYSPIDAEAATSTSTKTLVNDTYYAIPINSEKVIKIVVTEESYITLSAKLSGAYNSSKTYGSFRLLDSKKRDLGYSSFRAEANADGSAKVTTKKYATSPGTYYLSYYGTIYNSGKALIKYTQTKITQSSNFTARKALTLKQKTAKVIYQTQAYSYDRYFKYTTTAKRATTISITSSNYPTVYAYDSDYNKIKLTQSSYKYNSDTGLRTTIYKTDSIAAGTYYIRVADYNDLYETSYFSVKFS